MTPDTPLLFFWTCCLWALTRVLRDGNAVWWPVIGVFAGLAMASKYTAVLLWFGIALWLVITPSMRVWLRRPAPWVGALLAIAVFLPVLLWNAEHHWASFARQGGRVGAWQPANAVRFLAELVAGQIGLATPLIFAFCAGGIVLAAREAWGTRDPVWTLLASLTLPAIVLFVEHALGDRVQGNWPAIIYPAAGIAAAGLAWRRLFGPALAFGFGITLMVYAQASLALLPLPTRFDPIALRLAGWDELAAEVEAVRQREGASFVASDQYGVATELARSLPAGVAVVGIEPRWAWFGLPHASLVGQRGILVRTGRDGDQAEIAEVARRGGADVVQTYRIERINGTETMVLLPRP